MKRILLLNYEFPPVGGGAGNATYFLLQQFAQMDIAVDVVTSSETGSYQEVHFSSNIRIFRVPIARAGETATYGSMKHLLVYSLRALRKSITLMRANSYDMTHTFFGTPCGLLGFVLKRLFGVPYIVSLRGADVPGYKKRYAMLDRWLFWWLDRYIIWNYARKVIANSEQLKMLARKTAPNQDISVVPNGVDTEVFHPEPDRNDEIFRITCGWTRLESRKGIDILIQAFAELKQKIGEAPSELHILGTGKERNALGTLAESLGIMKDVIFYDIAENTDENRQRVAAILRSCDVLCLPSSNEGMSNAVLEGMACGLPLLLTDVGGTKEMLEDGVNGYILGKRVFEDVKEKLGVLYSDKGLGRSFGKESRKKAVEMSWLNMAEEYLTVYGR